MTTIRSYTDIKQSRKLAEILPIESADMQWFLEEDYGIVQIKEEELQDWGGDCTIPCWSLAALLNILPNYHVTNNGITGVVVWSLDTYSKEHDNPVDACYELILKLNDNNLL